MNDAIENLTLEDLDGRFDEDIARTLVLSSVEPPRLQRSDGEPDLVHHLRGAGRSGVRPDGTLDPDQAEYSFAYILRWQVTGDHSLLGYWPQEARDQPPTDVELRPERDQWIYDFPQFEFTWKGGEIWSYVEVFESEPDLEASRLSGIELRRMQLMRFMAAHEEAVRVCLDEVAADDVRWVAQRRRQEGFTRRALEGVELSEISTTPLEVTPVTQVSREVLVSLPVSLDEPSFARVVRKICDWADEIERYGRLLGGMREDAMTSSLCAALSLVFGAASHDEFVHNGHPDLVINSRRLMALRDRDLAADESPLFVAEAKRGSSATTATRAWDQLTNYLTRSAKHGALIFYIEQDNFEDAQEALLSALLSHRACVPGQQFDSSERLNVLKFSDPRHHRDLEIAIIGIRHAVVGTQAVEAEALDAAFAAERQGDSDLSSDPQA